MDDELAAFKAEMGGLLGDESASSAAGGPAVAAAAPRIISAAAPTVISAAPPGSGLSAAARKYGQTFDPSVVPAGAAATTTRNITKSIAGQTWKDETLLVWPEDDFRIFVGDLGNEANDDVLSTAFRKYPSFQMARVVRDKHSHKSKGYGFVSFKDPWDMTKALREMQGKYVGNRPIKIRKSTAQERDTGDGKKAPAQFNAALSVADKSMRRQLEKGGAIQKNKKSWKEKKKMLPW